MLKPTLEAGPTGDLAFIVTEKGKPYVKEAARQREGRVHELMATFGWVDIKEAEIYTRAAYRNRLAAQAMGHAPNWNPRMVLPHRVRPEHTSDFSGLRCNWCARRAVAFAAISRGYRDPLQHEVHFGPKSAFEEMPL